jgi:hypothetical protein
MKAEDDIVEYLQQVIAEWGAGYTDPLDDGYQRRVDIIADVATGAFTVEVTPVNAPGDDKTERYFCNIQVNHIIDERKTP